MILNSSQKFICLEYSNPIENVLINNITRWIFEQKQHSVKNCGAEGNVSFAEGTIFSYSAFLLTVEGTYFDTDDELKLNLENLYKYMSTEIFFKTISSYCLVRETPLYIEIWDVCVFVEKRRGQGVGNRLIQNALQLSPKNFWLCVLPDNMPAAILYIKNGFAVEKITQGDSSETLIFPNMSLISMVCNKQSPSSNIDFNIQLFKQMSDKILGFVKTEQLNIKIESDVINFIDALVKNQFISYEVGGCLMTKHTDKFNVKIETKDGKSFIVLEMNKFFIKGGSNSIGRITSEYNFMFITQPISSSNYNGLVVQMPFFDMTFCVQNILYNISRLIKTQKLFIFSFNGVISISISSFLTEFILTCLDQSLERNIQNEMFEHLQLCFTNLTSIKMYENYQESLKTNQYLILQHSEQTADNFTQKQTGNATCFFINKLSVKDLADTDQGGVISSMLSIFFNHKGLDISSIPVFIAEYHEISASARSEGLYISCQDTVVPRKLADLKYSVSDMVNPKSFSLENVLTRLNYLSEYTQFVLE